MPLIDDMSEISWKIKDLDGKQFQDRRTINDIVRYLNELNINEKFENIEEKLEDHIGYEEDQKTDFEWAQKDQMMRFDKLERKMDKKIDFLAYLFNSNFDSIEDRLIKKLEDHISDDRSQKMNEYRNVSERFFWRELLMFALVKYNNFNPVVYVEFNNLLEHGRKLEYELGIYNGRFSSSEVFHDLLSLKVLSQQQDRSFKIDINNPVNLKLFMNALS